MKKIYGTFGVEMRAYGQNWSEIVQILHTRKSALRWVYTFDAVKRFDTLSYASQMRIKAFCGVSVYTFHAGISARQRAQKSVARRKMRQSSTVLNFHALRQRTQAIQPIIYRCHELSLQRIDLAITSERSHWTIS